MTSEERLIVIFEMPPTHRYFVSAWMFLEDAAQRSNKETEPVKRVFQLVRLLGACAINLRMACEAQFGKKRLDRAPDQSLMFFITAARHINAHSIDGGLGQATVTAARATWSTQTGTGEIVTEVVLELDLKKSDLTPDEKRQATEYLKAHGNDLFLALHSAAETIAQWVGEEVDGDFQSLRTRSAGRFGMRQSTRDPAAFKKFVEGMTDLGLREGR